MRTEPRFLLEAIMAIIAVPEVVMIPRRHLEPAPGIVLAVLSFAILIVDHLLLEDEAFLYLLGEVDVVALFSKSNT